MITIHEDHMILDATDRIEIHYVEETADGTSYYIAAGRLDVDNDGSAWLTLNDLDPEEVTVVDCTLG